MKRMLLVTVGLVGAILFSPAASAQEADKPKAKAQRITLNIEGVECGNCARVMTAALQGTDIKILGAIKPVTQGPSRVIAECSRDCELGAVASKVNKAQTPHREKVAPSLALVLFTDPSTSEESVQAACRKLEGASRDGCKFNRETGEIVIQVAGDKELKLSQIEQAMKEADVKIRTASREEKLPQEPK